MSLFNLCDDIMELIEVELRPRLKYNQVVREYKDPRFHKSANRITKRVYIRDVHPGRHYLRVIYPTTRSPLALKAAVRRVIRKLLAQT